MSRDTMRMMGMLTKSGKTGPLMVRIKDPARAEAVRDQLNKDANGAYRAWTRQELAEANEGAIMAEQIIGIFLGFSVFLGFLIGVGITSQTLRGAILSSIKEFASLRALGVGMGSLRMIVMELSVWVGIAGPCGHGAVHRRRLSAGRQRRPAHGLSHALGHRRLHPPARDLVRLGPAGPGHPEEEPASGPPAMSSKHTAIQAHGVYKRFKTGRTHIEVLKRVDFDALHGEVDHGHGSLRLGQVDPGGARSPAC